MWSSSALPASWEQVQTRATTTGRDIVDNVSPLGFILGDEGARCRTWAELLVGDVLKNQTSPALKEKFLSEVNLTPGEIIDRVYRQAFPNRFGKLVAFPWWPTRTNRKFMN